MNITGNVRYKQTDELIIKAVFQLLATKKYDKFTIKDVCEQAGINRATFYIHYRDINDLMIKIECGLAKELSSLFDPGAMNSNSSFIGLFDFIRANQVFYKAFLKSHSPSFAADSMIEKQKIAYRQFGFDKKYNYTEAELDYHLRFFAAGIKAVCEQWVLNDCQESSEQMAKIIYDEYAINAKHFKQNETK